MSGAQLGLETDQQMAIGKPSLGTIKSQNHREGLVWEKAVQLGKMQCLKYLERKFQKLVHQNNKKSL